MHAASLQLFQDSICLVIINYNSYSLVIGGNEGAIFINSLTGSLNLLSPVVRRVSIVTIGYGFKYFWHRELSSQLYRASSKFNQ